MSDGLAKIATGFAMIAEGINELGLLKNTVQNNHSKDKEIKPQQEPKKITIEEVRAVLAAKSQEGKTAAVKTLLNKYKAQKLTEVNEENYEELLKEAEVL